MHEYLNAGIPEVLYADLPNYLTEALDNETEPEFATRLASQLEKQILEEGPGTIAAFIAEPVMGVGGVILPPHTYFEKIQAVLERYNILLIADEVICGFGRTGEMFGSVTFDLRPDILTVAKGISSAYFPISATLVTESIYSTLVEATARKGVFSHGFTYSGHPVGAAVALEAIAILEERDIPGHVRMAGAKLQEEIQGLCDIGFVANPRGVGLMAGFDLFADPEKKVPFGKIVDAGTLLMDIAEKHQLFIRSVGDTIVIAPPLIITKAEIDELIRRLRIALMETVYTLEKSRIS